MKLVPLAALVAAAMLSAMIALDIVWNANNPGQVGPWLDPETHPYLLAIVGTVHIVLYLLLAAALIQTGRAIDAGRRFVRVLRWLLISSFTLLAGLLSVLIVDPTFRSSVHEILSGVAFAVILVTPIILGFALIRRREFRAPVILLIAPIVLIPLTFVLEAFTAFAHPGYIETAVNLGLALLCVAASSLPAPSEPTRHGPASATMPVSEEAPDRGRTTQASNRG